MKCLQTGEAILSNMNMTIGLDGTTVQGQHMSEIHMSVDMPYLINLVDLPGEGTQQQIMLYMQQKHLNKFPELLARIISEMDVYELLLLTRVAPEWINTG